MKLAPKIILHSPVSDESLIDAFVEQCLEDRVSVVAIVGQNCSRLEDVIDEIIVGDGSTEGRFMCTTSHADETFEDVLDFLNRWDTEVGGEVQEVRL